MAQNYHPPSGPQPQPGRGRGSGSGSHSNSNSGSNSGSGGRGGGGGGGPPQNYNYAAARGNHHINNNNNTMGAWQPSQPTAANPYPQPQSQSRVQQQPHHPQQGYPPQAYYPYQQYNPRPWQPQPPQPPHGYPNMQGGVFYPGHMPQPQQPQQAPPSGASTSQPPVVVPAVRKKKPLQITDRDGNVLDLSGPKKTTPAAPAAPTTTAASSNTTTTTTPPASVTPPPKVSAEDAGAKLRQAALDAIGGGGGGGGTAKKVTASDDATTVNSAVTPSPKPTTTTAAAAASSSKAAATTSSPPSATTTSTATTATTTPTNSAATATKRGSSLAALVAAEDKPATAGAATATPSAAAAAPSHGVVADTSSGRTVYGKDVLHRLKDLPVCLVRPDSLAPMVIEKSAVQNKGRGGGPNSGGGSSRRNSNRDHGGGGGGDSWSRGNAPPRRQSSQADVGGKQSGGGGGDQWSRGQAPPKPQPNQQGQGGGGRQGGNNGGRGRHNNQVPLYDGPIEPLVKSENHWKPTKNTSALIVAEKKVKGILNKMTKEKFDRLSKQMLEIPIVSYDTLTLMIDNVYDKAIDEPAFGDMYADLCVRLSETVKGNRFVHIIESDEEPPTDDGQAAPPVTESSTSHTVYRWSNDIGTSDDQIVGPLSSAEECMTAAFDEEERTPMERGEMELELVSVTIKRSIFIKIMKKKTSEEGESDVFYAVYFPACEAKELGQQLSDIFLSEVECQSDANKKNTFKRSLLNKCEEEFNKQDIYADWQKEKAEYEQTKSKLTAHDRKEKEEDINFRRIKIKKQMLGNVKFIGQLYKKNLLKEKIMRYCIASQLKLEERKDVKGKNPEYTDTGKTDMDEEDHEAICSMFATIGATIDKPHAVDFLSLCFTKISDLSVSKDLPSRSKFMYKDLIDLRSNGWVPRRKEEKAKTIAEIRKDVEREERRQAQLSQQGHRGGRGGGGYDRGGGSGYDRSQRPMNNRPRAPKPVTHTDDDGFTTVSTGKAAAPPKSPHRPSETSKYSGAKPASAPPVAKSSGAALSDEDLKRKLKSMRNDYLGDGGDTKEVLTTWGEISGTPNAGKDLVSNNCDRMMDCKENERLAILKIVALLCENGKLTKSDVQDGTADVVEFIDSVVMDSPKAYEYMGEFFGEMLRIKMFDMSWICDQCQVILKDNPDSPSPEKMIRFALLTLKKNGGPDIAKAHLSEKKLNSALKADALQNLVKEL